MTTTTARKPAAKPARTMMFDQLSGMLRIAVGKQVDAYCVHEMPADGCRQVVLNKFGGEPTRYIVTVAGDAAICNCPAGGYGKPCKHVGAVVKMITRGLLGPAPVAAPKPKPFETFESDGF